MPTANIYIIYIKSIDSHVKYSLQYEWSNVRQGSGYIASLTQQTRSWANSGDSGEPGSLPCCSPWGHKEADVT